MQRKPQSALRLYPFQLKQAMEEVHCYHVSCRSSLFSIAGMVSLFKALPLASVLEPFLSESNKSLREKKLRDLAPWP